MPSLSALASESRPNCLRCVHYHVTWDPRAPHGCKALGFKSRYLPHVHVQQTSGMPCRSFKLRPQRRG
ncbi:MAG: uracil-DNA glycosylase [Deltaproteobacteria bacterium]|jgi:hypothetical protein|nr:uracil-DNA glycosylase [Deltaproteobacteria bacterium]